MKVIEQKQSQDSRRWVAHLDMDAFFASVELLRYPELRGMPVVVGGRSVSAPAGLVVGEKRFARLRQYAGRGVVTTATYEARALGVHSGMGLMKAALLAPEAILLPANFDDYRRLSRQFKSIVATIAPQIEDRGIDEIYIDFTPLITMEDERSQALQIAAMIQEKILTETGLSCSLGITPNKLLSKLASDLKKPMGISILTEDDIRDKLWPLPVKRVNGIGPKATARLAALGVQTIGELAAAPVEQLVAAFGTHYGRWLHESAHGRDERPVVTHREAKSLSRETTFPHDLHPRQDRTQLGEIFTHLSEQLAADLHRKGYVAKTIGVKLRYDDFRIVTRVMTLPEATDEASAIRLFAGRCLKRIPLDQRLRLLGIRAENLIKKEEYSSKTQQRSMLNMSLF